MRKSILKINIKKYIPKFLKIPLQKIKFLILSNFALIQWYQLSNKDLIKLELGSGAKKGEHGFITVDINGANITWDLKNGIPLQDNSVDLIYSSHLLEHIPFKELILFLKECRRVLKNNGVFSVCVPNAGNYLNAYFKGETFEIDYYPPALIETGSKIDQINYIAYMDGHHRYLFDEENLINTLLTAGFKYAQLRNFDSNLDSKVRDYESIYAIAKKN